VGFLAVCGSLSESCGCVAPEYPVLGLSSANNERRNSLTQFVVQDGTRDEDRRESGSAITRWPSRIRWSRTTPARCQAHRECLGVTAYDSR